MLIEIDASQGEGGGQILRTSLALSLVVVLALQAGMTVGEFTNFVTLMLMLLTPLKALAG